MFNLIFRLSFLGALMGCFQMDDETGSGPNLSDQEVQVVRPSQNPYNPSSSSEETISEDDVVENNLPSYTLTHKDPLSTFALDVDEGSYTLFKKYAELGSINNSYNYRAEEFVNYFEYNIESNSESEFTTKMELSKSHFRDSTYDLRFTLASPDLKEESLPWNLTLVIDISGSMQSHLSEVKLTLQQIVDQSKEGDIISIVTYSNSVKTLMSPTKVTALSRETIKSTLNNISSDGATYMSGGVEKGYEVNNSSFVQGGINRVIICSDGDANVGTTRWEGMVESIKSYKLEGIFLTNLGYGGANYNEANMEQLADHGNGNYYYLANEKDINHFIKYELRSATEIFAIDSKVQLTFDSTQVKAYRLRGYTNRGLADSDFTQDSTDAGEIGLGHQVTAVYEIILNDNIDKHKALGSLALRYKTIEYTNKEKIYPLELSVPQSSETASTDQKFIVNTVEYVEAINNRASATDSQLKGAITNLNTLTNLDELKAEFITLINKAR